jgi:hypothetical protein
MAQEYRSEQPGSQRNKVPPIPLHGVWAAMPLAILFGSVPMQISSRLVGFYAVIVHIFQSHDTGSAWLAFGLVWLACATVGLASTYVVFCVAKTRKRILGR